jgi:hypothetical protein
VATLVEEIDSLNTVSAGHSKEIASLKEKVAALEDRLAKAPTPQDLEAIRSEARTLKDQVAELRAAWKAEQEKPPLFTPTFQLRIRPEFRSNLTDLDKDAPDNDLFYGQRLRLGARFEPFKGVQGVVVLQDSRKWGSESDPSSNEKNLDLHEGYVALNDLVVPGLSVMAGRMELHYGAGRLIDRSDWSLNGRAFDGIVVSYAHPEYVRVDAFATVVKEAGIPSGHDTNFYGLYATSSYLKFLDIDLYALYLDNGTKNANESLATIGARVVGRPVDGLTLEGESVVQFGSREIRDQSEKLVDAKHLATAYFFQALYEIPVVAKPTIGGFFYSASGDADPFDDRGVAFRPLFGTRHNLMGPMEFFQWQGVWDAGGTVRATPHDTVGLRADYHRYYLTSDGGVLDGFGGKVTFPSGGSKLLGDEVDFRVSWKPVSYLAFETGYSFFKPGARAKAGTVTRSTGTYAVLGVVPASAASGQTTGLTGTGSLGSLTTKVDLGADLAHWFYFSGTVNY